MPRTNERSGPIPMARMTKCICGHTGIEHYDSYLFCTLTVDGGCDCEEFRPVGPEIHVQVGEAMESV